jgi:hypothetical protein
MSKLTELIPDPKVYWEDEIFKKYDVLWVLGIACSCKPPVRDHNSPYRRSLRRKVVRPPETGSLHMLLLPPLVLSRENQCSQKKLREISQSCVARTSSSMSPLLPFTLPESQKLPTSNTQLDCNGNEAKHSSITLSTDIQPLSDLETKDMSRRTDESSLLCGETAASDNVTS